MPIGVGSKDFGLNFDVVNDHQDVDGFEIDPEHCSDRLDIPDLLIHTVYSPVDKAVHTKN